MTVLASLLTLDLTSSYNFISEVLLCIDFYIAVLTRYSNCVDICTHCMLQGEVESINQRVQECIMSDKDLYQDILMYKVGQQCSCVYCAGNIIHRDHSFCLQYESLRTRLCTIITATCSMYLSVATGTLHNSSTAQDSWSQHRQREAG